MSQAPSCFVGVDMGTTNSRAWLVHEGEILAVARAPFGVRDSAMAGSNSGVAPVVGRLVEEVRSAAGPGFAPRCVLAAGMITSPLGLAEVPHVGAPAGLAELAAGMARLRIAELPDLAIRLVPGVKTGHDRLPPEGIGGADVMRGEESFCIGLLESGELQPGGTLLSLGSHWKRVQIDAQGRIAGSTTSLGGELLHAAQSRTVLASSVPQGPPGEIDGSWLRAGVAEAERSGLTRALFCVRLLEQRSEGDGAQRLSFLVGAMIGAELAGWGRGDGGGAGLLVTGGEAVAAAFAGVLRERGREVRVIAGAEAERAMVRGLRRIAAAAEEAGGGEG